MTDLGAIRAQMRVRQFSQSDVGDVNLARCLLDDIAACSGDVRPVSTRGSLYAYSGDRGVWCEIPREQLMALAQAYDGVQVGYVRTIKDGGEEAYTKPMRLGSARVKGIHDCILTNQDSLDMQFFESAPVGVAFQNGFAVVTKDGVALKPKSPENRTTTYVPYDFDPDAPAASWRKVLSDVFAGAPDAEERKQALQEFAGACITGSATNYTRCLVALGAGANGKSVVAETLAELLFDQESVTYTTPQSWGARFTLARLKGSRLNIATELPDAEIESSDIFKAVVDGGRCEVETKGRDGYTMRPRAGHLFLANALPRTTDFSHGFWRRFLLVMFERDFSKDPSMETKEAVKARLAKEAPGIMVWALYGAVRLLRNGKYTEPVSHRLRLADWRRDVDAVASFVDECCSQTDERTYMRDIHGHFKEWCALAGRQPMSNVSLGLRLKGLQISGGRDGKGAFYNLNVLPRGDWAYGKVTGVMGSCRVESYPTQPQLHGLTQESAHV